MGTTLEDKDAVQDNYRASVKKMGDILYYRYVRNNFNLLFDVKSYLAGLLNEVSSKRVMSSKVTLITFFKCLNLNFVFKFLI